MSAIPKSPSIYVEAPDDLHIIKATTTSVTAFIGKAITGPINNPERIINFPHFEQIFGGLDRGSEMSYAVFQFFENGGRIAWIVRLASNKSPLNNHFDINNPLIFIGNKNNQEGLYALESIKAFNLLCVPGITNTTILNTVANYCQKRSAFLIIDSPSNTKPNKLL